MKISNLDAAVTISRALGHPARLRTVSMLRSGELCVCQVTEVLQLAQSTVSTHLRELKRAGLVVERKQGRWVFFSLSADDPETSPWLDAALRTLESDDQIARDDRTVEEIRGLPVEDVCRHGFEAAKALANSKTAAKIPKTDPPRSCR